MDWHYGSSWGLRRDKPIFEGVIEILEALDDDTARGPRPIHIVIEAAHPDQLGRPSELVMREIMHARSQAESRPHVRFHFIEDRIRIPPDLSGHIICIGGPRSNVIARAALEYELDFANNKTIYRRILSPSLQQSIPYMTHGATIDHHMVHFDYSILDQLKYEFSEDRLQEKIKKVAESRIEDWSRTMAGDQLTAEDGEPDADGSAEKSSKAWQILLKCFRLYSPGRFFQIPAEDPRTRGISAEISHWRSSVPYQGRSLAIREKPVLSFPEDRAANAEKPNVGRPPFANGDDRTSSPLREWILYDQTKLTIMPNVFSGAWKSDRMIIYHGLRSLGTLAALFMIRDSAHVRFLKDQVARSLNAGEVHLPLDDEALGENRNGASSFPLIEHLWSVYRDVDYKPGPGEPKRSASDDDLRHFDDGVIRWARPRLCHGPAETAIAREKKAMAEADAGNGAEPKSKPAKVAFETQNTQNALATFHESLTPPNIRRLAQSMKRALVQLNQINAEQILDAMALHRGRERVRDGIYILGCFEAQKTFYTQQCRAYTLIHALHKAGKVRPGRKVIIVGAGPSGIAAAVAAAKTGLRVILLDKHEEFDTKFDGASHRYVHPYVFDWPNLQRIGDRSDLPGMDWSANPANEVWQEILGCFEAVRTSVRHKRSDQQAITVVHNFDARTYFYDAKNDRHCLSKLAPQDFIDEDESKGGNLAKWLRKQLPDNMASDGEARAFGDAVIAMVKRMYQPEGGLKKRLAETFPKSATKDGRGSKTAEETATFEEERSLHVQQAIAKLRHDSIVDGDILIFATGFGEEQPEEAILDLIDLNGPIKGGTKLGPAQIADLKRKILDADGERTVGPAPHNKSYWKNDDEKFLKISELLKQDHGRWTIEKDAIELPQTERRTVIVSGSGDGALADIMRLCIRDYDQAKLVGRLLHLISVDEDHEVHETADINRLRATSAADFRTVNERNVASRLKRAAHAMDELLSSDKFRALRSEARRIDELEKTLAWPDMGNIFDELGVELNPVLVYNVDLNLQPFGPDSSTVNRLLVFALYRARRVLFFQGRLVGTPVMADGSPARIPWNSTAKRIAAATEGLRISWSIHRTNNGQVYHIDSPRGIIVRHGIGNQPASFLNIAGLIQEEYDARENEMRSREEVRRRIYREGRSLIAFLKLTSGLHPETYKFYNYTLRALE